MWDSPIKKYIPEILNWLLIEIESANLILLATESSFMQNIKKLQHKIADYNHQKTAFDNSYNCLVKVKV
ncbi:hypothetical protein [Flavobacterium sp. ABG]|uniref:hypothetical protein n=1 Tax=Flavobacterium sp. ABG TaxID=1423322 RepID=UPI00064A8C38|nr:hypothetical protein [Flavobacterium sp. ABG]KLT71239.1 hypothetical protein AB674_01735 [Flavobacterium sp. ABG]